LHRLFIAIDLPDAIKDQLRALCIGVPGAKWVKREQLHLTVRFIGEVETAKFQEIKSALKSVQGEPFRMAVQGMGQFPPKRAARVLWVGLDAPPALHQLHEAIEGALGRAGIAPEDRPFAAHITLGRLKTPAPLQTVQSYLARHANLQSEAIPVERFTLYSSVLSPHGPTYRPEGIYPLH
jgi:2'-5' RNA ligase